MHGDSHRPVRPTIPVLACALIAAVCCSGTALAAAGSAKAHGARPAGRLAGTWSGTYSGAFSGTFRLHWTQTGTKLHGSITLSYPGGTYSVTGSVHGSAITFGAVGAGATYSGSFAGSSMSGRYRTPRGGGGWSAHKTS